MVFIIYSYYRKKLSKNLSHPCSVSNIALQPFTSGNVIATSCFDIGKLKIFDIRSNISLATEICYPGGLISAMFSPSEPALVGLAGIGGGLTLYDIRHPKKCLHTFSTYNHKLIVLNLN